MVGGYYYLTRGNQLNIVCKEGLSFGRSIINYLKTRRVSRRITRYPRIPLRDGWAGSDALPEHMDQKKPPAA
jgi:hypothetical protein